MRQCRFAKFYIQSRSAQSAHINIFSERRVRIHFDILVNSIMRLHNNWRWKNAACLGGAAYRCRYLSTLYLVLTYVTRECNVREFGTIISRRKSPRERNCISMQAAVICTFTVRRGCKSRCCFACMRVIISRRGARRMGGARKTSVTLINLIEAERHSFRVRRN